jgi:hypothetical protein
MGAKSAMPAADLAHFSPCPGSTGWALEWPTFRLGPVQTQTRAGKATFSGNGGKASKQVSKKDSTTENVEGHGGPRRRGMALRAMFDHTFARSAQNSCCSVHSPWSSVFSVVRSFLAEDRAPVVQTGDPHRGGKSGPERFPIALSHTASWACLTSQPVPDQTGSRGSFLLVRNVSEHPSGMSPVKASRRAMTIFHRSHHVFLLSEL